MNFCDESPEISLQVSMFKHLQIQGLKLQQSPQCHVHRDAGCRLSTEVTDTRLLKQTSREIQQREKQEMQL